MNARRYRCMGDVTPRCVRGDGAPKRKKCPACGSALLVERGAYGVFEWTGSGRYPESAALSLHRTDAQAFAKAVEMGPQYVSRWIGVSA